MTSANARVLILGEEPSDFTNAIAACARAEHRISVDILDLRGVSAESAPSYDAVIPPPQLALGRYRARELLAAACQPRFLRGVLQHLRRRPARDITRAQLSETLRSSLIADWARRLFASYDLVNFHYLTPGALRFVPYVPRDVSVVASFWGDDLSHTDRSEAQAQLAVLERADVITVSSPELRELMLAKYGRRFAPKVRPVLLGVEARLTDLLDRRDPGDARRSFCARHGIDPDSLLVAVGYSGSHRHHHLEVMAELTRLPDEVRSRLVLVMPMTYGAYSPSYPGEVERRAQELGLSAVIVREYMDLVTLAELRLACDVLIFVPENDGLSASLVESLWAGSIAIVNSWMPYGTLRAANVELREVSSFAQIPFRLLEIDQDLPAIRARARRNREHLAFLRNTEQAHNWCALYRDLLGPTQQPGAAPRMTPADARVESP